MHFHTHAHTPTHRRALQYDDVVKFDFGTHINGRIINCTSIHTYSHSHTRAHTHARLNIPTLHCSMMMCGQKSISAHTTTGLSLTAPPYKHTFSHTRTHTLTHSHTHTCTRKCTSTRQHLLILCSMMIWSGMCVAHTSMGVLSTALPCIHIHAHTRAHTRTHTNTYTHLVA